MAGRNDPCPCGSGKKHKKCCLSKSKPESAAQLKALKYLKSSEEIEKMRIAGAFNGELIDMVRSEIIEGISTEKINTLVHDYTLDHGHTPATLGYGGFPKSSCTSLNNVVCHGIPSAHEILKDGDIINVDLTTIVNGYFGDQSETFFVGTPSDEAQRLVQTTARATIAAIEAIAPGKKLSIVGDTIAPIAEDAGFNIVRTYTGHGIGSEFHENITVLHHRNSEGAKITLVPGMTFTIEPMINIGGWQVTTDPKDGWTVRTKDSSLSAQFEHTLLVTDTGVEVLTLTPSQKQASIILAVPEVR